MPVGLIVVVDKFITVSAATRAVSLSNVPPTTPILGLVSFVALPTATVVGALTTLVTTSPLVFLQLQLVVVGSTSLSPRLSNP